MSKISKLISEMVSDFMDDEYDLYYGGGESDWGVEEEPSYVDNYVYRDGLSDLDREKQQLEDLKIEFYEDLIDLVNQRTNWEYNSEDVEREVRREMDMNLSRCTSDSIISKWRDMKTMADDIIKNLSFS